MKNTLFAIAISLLVIALGFSFFIITSKGQLALETQLGKEVHEVMKLGAKTGMWKFSLSIGYDTQEYEMQEVKVGQTKIKVRLIKKAELWEISIVKHWLKGCRLSSENEYKTGIIAFNL